MGNVRSQGERALTDWEERRITLGSFARELRAHPRLSIGFGLFWTWVWLVFQATYFSPSFLQDGSVPLPGWVVPLFGYAVTFLALGGLLKRRGIVPRGRGYLIAIPVVMSLGTLICCIATFSPLAIPAVNVMAACVGGLLMGAGTACLHVEWGRKLGDLGSRITLLHGVVGTIIAALLTVLITLLPTPLLWVVALIIPPASMCLLVRDAPDLTALCTHGLEARFHVPRRFLATAFVQGLSFGIVQAILLLGGHQEPVVALSAASFALSAAVLFLCALFFRMDFNQLIYQVGFFIMALGYLLLALAGTGFLGGLFVHTTGYRFVDIMMWALCAYLIKHRGLSANWVFAITTCFLLLGQIVGAVVGNAAIAALTSTSIAGNLATVMVFVLLASSLIMSDRKNLRTGWGMVRPGDFEEEPSTFDLGCSLVCDRFDLTTREREVFVLLARGMSRAAICDELTLSRETVKTHVRNIYRKLDAHAQQDVIALVEAEQQALGGDNFDDDMEREPVLGGGGS